MWEVASEEDDSHWDLAGPDPDCGASPPPVVGTPFVGGVAPTAAAVEWHPCNLRISKYLSQTF